MSRRFHIVAFFIAMAGCGAQGTETPDRRQDAGEDIDGSTDGGVDAGVCEAGTTIFLNKDGGEYTRVTDSLGDSRTNETPLLEQPSITIGAWPFMDAWPEIVSCMRSVFSEYDVTLVDTAPSEPHIEVVFGDASALAFGGPEGNASVSPFDCDDASRSEITFVFGSLSTLEDPILACKVGARTVGPLLGLDATSTPSDIMGPTTLGPTEPGSFMEGTCLNEDCQCTDDSTQDGDAVLLSAIGPRTCR